MPTVKFPPHPNQKAGKQALREGMTPEECAVKFDVSERTAYRWLKDVREEMRREALPSIQPARASPIRITVELEFKDTQELLEILLRGLRHDQRIKS